MSLPNMSHSVLSELARFTMGKKLGNGCFRDVYVYAQDNQYVIKIENDAGSFHNVREWEFWRDNEYNKDVAKWLAPCHSISDCGVFLLQERTVPLVGTKGLPDRIPKFLSDVKLENFGRIKRRLVCHDYGYTTGKIPVRLKKADWWSAETSFKQGT